MKEFNPVAVGDDTIDVFVHGWKLFTLRRENGLWTARDAGGNIVDRPDKYRSDLLERLQIMVDNPS